MEMLGQVAYVSVYVRDMDRALRFYSDHLGFERRGADLKGSEVRSLSVARAGGQTEVVLSKLPAAGTGARGKADPRIGSFTGLVFSTGDIKAVYENLSASGVQFVNPPKHELWGSWASFADPDGNTLILVQSAPPSVPARVRGGLLTS